MLANDSQLDRLFIYSHTLCERLYSCRIYRSRKYIKNYIKILGTGIGRLKTCRSCGNRFDRVAWRTRLPDQSISVTLTNEQTDEYGGSLEKRYQFVKEIIEQIRGSFKGPLWIRLPLTAYDDSEKQNSLDDWKTIGKWLEKDGIDWIDVSTGGLQKKKIGYTRPSRLSSPIHLCDERSCFDSGVRGGLTG